MTSLADELRGSAPAPSSFRLLLPPGWLQYPVDDDARARLLASVHGRFKQLGRPDLDAQLTAMVRKQWRALKQMGALTLYLPGAKTETPIPMSIVAVPYTATAGATLEADVHQRVSVPIEAFDLAHGRVYRWVGVENAVNGENSAFARTISALYPVPGEDPRRGMLLATSILGLRSGETESMLESLTGLSDAIVETFRWR